MSKLVTVLELPFINISAALTMETHSLTSFRELPSFFETYVEPSTGKKTDVFFWVGRGIHSLEAYDGIFVRKAIFTAVLSYITDQTPLRPPVEVVGRLVDTILSYVPEENVMASKTHGAFYGAAHRDEKETLATLHIDALGKTVEVDIYEKGAITEDPVDSCLCGMCKAITRVDFAYNTGRYTALIEFDNKVYGDWFSPTALENILNSAISNLTNSIADSFK